MFHLLFRSTYFVLAFATIAAVCLGEEAGKPLPVPDEAKVKEALKLVGDVYKKEFEAAKSPKAKRDLARTILKDAQSSSEDAASQFAMLTAARKIANGIGDVDLAMDVVDAAAQRFEIDEAPLRRESLSAMQATTSSDYYLVTRYAVRIIKRLVAKDRLEAAVEIATQALAAARKTNDGDLVKQWTRRHEQLVKHAKAFQELAPALKTLDTSPTDAAANTVAGRYYCLYKDDWSKGLPMLAIGDDAELAKLAASDIAPDQTPAAQLATADAWFDVAQKVDQPGKQATLRYVAKRYELLSPTLPALTKRRVENRIAEIADATSGIPKNEWVEILDLVELPKHLVQDEWTREGLSICSPTNTCPHFKVPVIVSGSYELKIRAVRLSAGEGLSVSLNAPGNDAQLALNCWGGTASGISKVDGRGGDTNVTKTPPAGIATGRPYTLLVQADVVDDKLTLNSSIDGRRYLRWAGPAKSLSSTFAEFRGGFIIGVCNTPIEIQSVQLKVKSGVVRLVD